MTTWKQVQKYIKKHYVVLQEGADYFWIMDTNSVRLFVSEQKSNNYLSGSWLAVFSPLEIDFNCLYNALSLIGGNMCGGYVKFGDLMGIKASCFMDTIVDAEIARMILEVSSMAGFLINNNYCVIN